jgi:hypothetical protein
VRFREQRNVAGSMTGLPRECGRQRHRPVGVLPRASRVSVIRRPRGFAPRKARDPDAQRQRERRGGEAGTDAHLDNVRATPAHAARCGRLSSRLRRRLRRLRGTTALASATSASGWPCSARPPRG